MGMSNREEGELTPITSPFYELREGMDIYESLAKYEIEGRLDKYDIGGADPLF